MQGIDIQIEGGGEGQETLQGKTGKYTEYKTRMGGSYRKT